MRLFLIAVLTIISFAHANTEAFFFNAKHLRKSSVNESLINTTITPITPNTLTIKVNAPNNVQSNTYLFPIENLDSIDYNAKVSWSALDPIQVLEFDVIEGPFVLLTVRYDCYTKDGDFMNNDHDVDLIIMLDPCLLRFIPKSLIPVSMQIIIVALLSVFVISPIVYNYLM